MSDASTPLPTDAELRILKVLWDRGPQTVREVHEIMVRTRDLQYTTTLRILQNMHQKGLVLRDDSERSHVYRSAIDQDWTTRSFVSDLTERVFEGSTAKLVLRALSSQRASKKELKEIRLLLKALEEEP